MPFTIIRNDITKVTADAIVNTANPRPVIGGGTDSAIYHAAGEELLLAERQKIGEIDRGDAAYTPAFGLNAKYIIHTVGPAWIDGKHHEREILHSCYKNSLALAEKLSCESVAFPLISTGVYRFPKDEALNIALAEISRFLLTHDTDMDVILVVFDGESLQLSKALIGNIEEYIDEHTAKQVRAREFDRWPTSAESPKSRPGRWDFQIFQKRRKPERKAEVFEDSEYCGSESELSAPMSAPVLADSAPDGYGDWNLDNLLTIEEDTFQQRLFRLIDERHLQDPEVYKKANISRKVFSKIRCNKDYHPTKKTAVAFAIALELDLPETRDLLSRAGLALSPGSTFDRIILFCVTHRIYDIFEINAALFKYDQELLGY